MPPRPPHGPARPRLVPPLSAAAAMLLAAAHASEPASELPPAAAPGDYPATAAVPGIPMVKDIETLPPIPLRREVSRAEGRISDLRKARRAELAGLDATAARVRAAIEHAQAATAVLGMAQAGSETAYAATRPDASETEPLLNAGTQAERRLEITRRYSRLLGEAQERLELLLERQAEIDPEAPDQQRLREAGDPDTAAHWPEPSGG